MKKSLTCLLTLISISLLGQPYNPANVPGPISVTPLIPVVPGGAATNIYIAPAAGGKIVTNATGYWSLGVDASTDQFGFIGNKLAIKSGANITNLYLYGILNAEVIRGGTNNSYTGTTTKSSILAGSAGLINNATESVIVLSTTGGSGIDTSVGSFIGVGNDVSIYGGSANAIIGGMHLGIGTLSGDYTYHGIDTLSAGYNVIGGGDLNWIGGDTPVAPDGCYIANFLGGGFQNNFVNGATNSIIVGGYKNTVDAAKFSVILGGYSNKVSKIGSFVIGNRNTNNIANTIMIGFNNQGLRIFDGGGVAFSGAVTNGGTTTFSSGGSILFPQASFNVAIGNTFTNIYEGIGGTIETRDSGGNLALGLYGTDYTFGNPLAKTTDLQVTGVLTVDTTTNTTGTTVRGQLPITINGVVYYIDIKK